MVARWPENHMLQNTTLNVPGNDSLVARELNQITLEFLIRELEYTIIEVLLYKNNNTLFVKNASWWLCYFISKWHLLILNLFKMLIKNMQCKLYEKLYHSCLIFSFNRGVGCIFIEMITGKAAFQGMKDTMDQLDKIWRVRQTFPVSHLSVH